MKRVKKISLALGKSLLIFLALVCLYLIAAYCCSRIEVAREEGHPEEVEIFILTNGVHTDIVMPVSNTHIDWSAYFPTQNTRAKASDNKYISLGWGDKGFYLETPTWADLKASVALKAAFALSNSAIHATYYNEMHVSESCVRLMVSADQYKRLTEFVQSSLDLDASGKSIWINTDAVYGDSDAFYEARGSYSLFHTCNTWANNALKACGQKSCLWTIFDTGIFLKYQNS